VAPPCELSLESDLLTTLSFLYCWSFWAYSWALVLEFDLDWADLGVKLLALEEPATAGSLLTLLACWPDLAPYAW
jgi:hypothetical protein